MGNNQSVKILTHVDGDMLNEFDGILENSKLKIDIKISAPENCIIDVNGVNTYYNKGIYSVNIALENYENKIYIKGKSEEFDKTITVYWLKNYTKKYRISLDDNIRFLEDIARNSNKYESIFDNSIRFKRPYNKERNVEALFMTLKKSDKEYSPTTLYDDYAINESIFHSQSQNATSPESPKGISYIRHIEQGKQILLFVREQNEDEYGFTMGYVFLGDASYISSTGSRPMNINWRLETPMPAYLLNESTKLAVG